MTSVGHSSQLDAMATAVLGEPIARIDTAQPHRLELLCRHLAHRLEAAVHGFVTGTTVLVRERDRQHRPPLAVSPAPA